MNATTSVLPIENRRNTASRLQLLRRIRAEFYEMPCLRLTRPQAQRLFGLRPDVCERVLAILVGEGTLICGPDGRYGLHADVAWRGRMFRPAGDERSRSVAS